MTSDAAPRMQRSPRRRAAVATLAVVLLGSLALAILWKVRDVRRAADASTPLCAWPAHIEHASPTQDGLIRCYLQAVADHSTGELRSVVPSPGDHGPTGFGTATFTHAADARSGTATVTVTGNDSDSADATVAIDYADGARTSLEIHLADPSSADSWRFVNIGIYPADPKFSFPPTRR